MYVPKTQNNALAAGLIVLAAGFIAATSLMAKALATDAFGTPLHALQISHGRFLFAFAALWTAATLCLP